MRSFKISVLLLGSVFLSGSAVCAASPDEEWQFELVPFFWGLAFDGSTTVASQPPIDIDVDLNDVLSNFNIGAALFGSAQKGKWSLITEITYLSLDQDEKRGGINVDTTLDTYLFMTAAGYRLPTDVAIDLYGGGRYMQVDIETELNGTKILNADRDWIDPIIGFRLFYPFNDTFSFNIMADLGGFGAGSDLSYSIMPVLAFQFTDTIGAKLAYRWLDVDYDKDNFAMDMLMSGPMLGVSFKW